jgi:hypothetical protein
VATADQRKRAPKLSPCISSAIRNSLPLVLSEKRIQEPSFFSSSVPTVSLSAYRKLALDGDKDGMKGVSGYEKTVTAGQRKMARGYLVFFCQYE